MIFSKIYNTINSKNKSNIRFVALSSYQIEFFEIEGNEYFCIYRYSGEQAHHMLINLESASVCKINDGFQISDGYKSYKIVLKNNDKKIKLSVVLYLWGWLPFQRFSGKVSNAGISTFNYILSSRVNSIV